MQRIEDCVSFLAGKAAQSVYRAARDTLACYGITPVQYAVLQILWESDGPTGAEMCNRLRLDSATITGVLDRLEKLELVQRTPDPEDRRANRIHLTRKGKAHREPLQKAMDLLNRDLAESLGNDAPRVWKALRRLAAYERR